MFRPTQILYALKQILWTDINVYRRDPGTKAKVEAAVKAHYDAQNLEARDVEQARIR